jgi:hypothetical protein
MCARLYGALGIAISPRDFGRRLRIAPVGLVAALSRVQIGSTA